LTSNEFVLFVRKVTGDKAAIDESTASRFIQFIDTSKDGKIDKTEILSFILHGVGLSTTELVLYSERSIAHKVLARVITSFQSRMKGGHTWPLHSGSQSSPRKLNLSTWKNRAEQYNSTPSPRGETNTTSQSNSTPSPRGETNTTSNRKQNQKKMTMTNVANIVFHANNHASDAIEDLALHEETTAATHEENEWAVHGIRMCLPCEFLDSWETKIATKLCPHVCCKANHIGGMCRRTILSFLMLLIALILFATWIQFIEAPLEIERNVDYVHFMKDIQTSLAPEKWERLKQHLNMDPTQGSVYFTSYVGAPSQTSLAPSINSNNSTPVSARMWTTSYSPFENPNVVFYVFTLATTIGYGDFAPLTNSGKWISMLCLLVLVPFTVAVYMKSTKCIFATIIRLLLHRDQAVSAAFNHFDVDSSNSISYTELTAALAMLHLHLTKREVKGVMYKYDVDKNGTLSMDEFQMIVIDFGVNIRGIAVEHFKIQLVAIFLIFWFFLYSTYFHLVDGISYIDSMWMCMATFSTTGLGDVVPSTHQRWPAVFLTMLGLGFTALGIDAASTCVNKSEEKNAMKMNKQHDMEIEKHIRMDVLPGSVSSRTLVSSTLPSATVTK
jgi:hypothetical protein